jgi:peptidyl-prolyl cis-trans isomerase SurA
MNRQFLTTLATGLASGLAAAAFFAVSATGQTPPQAPRAGTAPQGQAIDGVVALVNGELISQWDVRNRMRMLLMSFPGKPDQRILQEVQREAIDTLIDEKIQVQEFTELAKGQKIEDEEVDEEIGRLAQQNRLTAAQFTQQFTDGGANIQTLRDQIRADIAWRALIGGRYGKSVRVSEMRVDETMDRIKESLDKPQYRVAEIFLFAPDQASRENARTRADALIEQINKGAKFENVARQFSAAPSAAQGGDLSWLTLGDLRPEVASAVQKAGEPPMMLAPIDSDGGIYVIALLGKRDPAQITASFNLMQVVATGDSAGALLQQVKTKAKTCAEIDAAIKDVQGVSATDLKDIAMTQLKPELRTVLEPLQAGGSTDILDVGDNAGKMAFYVCERNAAGNELPSREELRSRLLDSEIAMIRERYLRDLKREATIERR